MCDDFEMHIEVHHFLDMGEQDSLGRYDYYYEGDDYVFRDGNQHVLVRVYADEPHIANVVNLKCARARQSVLARRAVAYLEDELGIAIVKCIGPDGHFVPWDTESP